MWLESHTFGWPNAHEGPPGGLADEITGHSGALKQFHGESCDAGHSRQAPRVLSGAAGYLPSPAGPGRPCPRSRPTVPTSAEPVAAPSATRPDCLSRQALAVSVPGRSSPACQERSSRLPSATRPFTCPPRQASAPHLGPGRPSPRPSGTRRGSPPRPGRAPATNRHPTSSIAPAMCPRASPRAGVTPRTPLPYATSPKFFPDAPSGTPVPLAVETSGPRPSYADRRNFFFAPVRRAGTAKGSSRGEFTWKCVPAWSRRPCCPRAGAGPC